jgi:hypothetical protein
MGVEIALHADQPRNGEWPGTARNHGMFGLSGHWRPDGGLNEIAVGNWYDRTVAPQKAEFNTTSRIRNVLKTEGERQAMGIWRIGSGPPCYNAVDRRRDAPPTRPGRLSRNQIVATS